jgi:hypothetical protein
MDDAQEPGTAQSGPEGVLARLWDAWVGADSPDDGSAPAFVRTAEEVTGDGADEAEGGGPDGGGPDGGSPDGGSPDGGSPDGGSPDGGSPDGGAGDGTADGAGAAADDGPSAVQVFTSDSIVSDQIDALGAVGNTSDGALSADGTYDVDWT